MIEAIGWLAAALSASMSIPQAVQITRSRTDAGVALGMWQGGFACGLSWLIYGLIVGTQQIIWPNGLWAALSMWIIWQVTRARSLNPLRTFGIPLGGAGLTIGAFLLAGLVNPTVGAVVFSVGAFIPVAAGQLAQLRATRNMSDVSGVSRGALWLNLACLVTWLVYAVPSKEVAVICVDTPLVILVALNIVALRNARARQAAATSD